MHVVQDLDGVSILRASTDGKKIFIMLCAPAGFTENNHYYPAESFTLEGLESIASLHRVLTDLLDEHATIAGL